MDIYMSINNREKVLRFPVLPSEFSVPSPFANESYVTVGSGELNLIGKRGLKSISWNCHFPTEKRPYSKPGDIWGWDIVSMIETLRDRKLPFRLIITDTPINMAVTIENFDPGMKAGTKDIQYSIEFKEFKFPEVG